ncbi:MAG: efflux RND transporter periplasmic adaptor subunit [Syntrophaceae bacterium]|nr:efflux RND transporter periplasmic adaptor subunit [Syntrophaceae bacterium]
MKFISAAISVLLIFTAVPAFAFQADGLIEPHRVVNLGSPQQGIIATIDVERGNSIREGQVLATLQSEVEMALMELKKANKDFAERKKERLEPLYEQELLAPLNMDEAETARALAEAEYKHAHEVVKRTKISSPVNGVVVEVFLSPGEYVENQPIMKLAEINPLNVEVILPLDKYRSVKLGTKAQVIPESPIGGQYSATVVIVDRVIDAASGTFGVRLKLPNPNHRIPAGIKCKVLFP